MAITEANKFILEGESPTFKSNSPWFLLNKNIRFNKNERKSKIENPRQSFRKMKHVFQLV